MKRDSPPARALAPRVIPREAPQAYQLSGLSNEQAGEPPEADAQELLLAFAPLHKRALGTAFGVAGAFLMFALTCVHLVRDPEGQFPLRLLSEYFYGYRESLHGALIGAGWGFVVGFVAGWFVAFCRNLAVAISIFAIRTRAELTETRDFLDHI